MRIATIADTQIMDGVPTDHLRAYGEWIAAKQPEVIVHLGDHWDFPSLSFHNKPGSIALEGRRYVKDFDAGRRALDEFLSPIARARGYRPTMVYLLGNHCILPSRQAAQDARLEGALKDPVEVLEQYGWKVYPFLQPVVIGGTAFSHYFPSGALGKPVSTASMLLRKLHMSAVAGHQQGRDIAYARRADGAMMTGLISGSFYQHQMQWMSPAQNLHWRGTFVLNEVRDGQFDELALSISYLKRRHLGRKGRKAA